MRLRLGSGPRISNSSSPGILPQKVNTVRRRPYESPKRSLRKAAEEKSIATFSKAEDTSTYFSKFPGGDTLLLRATVFLQADY